MQSMSPGLHLRVDQASVAAPVAATEGRQQAGSFFRGAFALSALPMALLAWVVLPAIIPYVPLHPGLTFWLLMIVHVSSLLMRRLPRGELYISPRGSHDWLVEHAAAATLRREAAAGRPAAALSSLEAPQRPIQPPSTVRMVPCT